MASNEKNYPQWIKALRVPAAVKESLYQQYISGNIAVTPEEVVQNYNWGTIDTVIGMFRALRNVFVQDPLPTGPKAEQVTSVVTGLDDKQLSSEFSKVRSAVAKGAQTVQFGGRNYTLTEARDIVRPLLSAEVQERTAVETGRDKELLKKKIQAERELSAAAAEKATASREWNTALSDFSRGRIEEADLRVAEQKAISAGVDVERARSGVAQAAVTTPPRERAISAQAQRLTQQAAATPRPIVGAGDRAEMARFERMRPTTPVPPTTTTPTVTTPTGGGGGGGGGTRPVTRQQVADEIAATGVADTAENRKAIRARLAAGEKIPANWEARFRQEFPQYQYLLDETVFGADMTALLQRAVLEKWFDSDEAKTLMEQGFAATEYAQNTTTNQQNFDKLTPGNKQAQIDKYKLEIKQAYGNLQIDDASLTTIATKAARDAKTGKGLELFIYQEALAKPVGTNVYAMQTAATRALTSGEADRIRQIGRDYGFQLSNQEVEDVLTGRKTEDDLRQSYKIAARRWYKGVAEDLDAGLTIDQIFKPYRQYAAQILEKPIDQIDLVDTGGAPSIYSEALQGQDGPLSLTEWAQKLKSDPKYGYQYTSRANQEVSSVVRSLEKAFGFTR